MYKVSACYVPPEEESMYFDYAHYLSVHVPMMDSILPGKVPLKKVDISRNVETLARTRFVGGRAKSERAASAESVSPLVVNIYFDDRDDAYAFADFVVGEDAAELHRDLVKFTNCSIRWMVGEVKEFG